MVRELIASADISGGVMTILMFPGMSCGAVCIGEANALATFPPNGGSAFNVLGYSGSNGLDYTGVEDGTGGSIFLNDLYASWRLVSQGLRLSLLNPAETDDGWWESARIHVGADPANYQLFGNNLTDDATTGVVIPGNLIKSIASGAVSLVNENSYTTGTLRDVKNHLFTLHPQKDDHDFVHPRTTMTFNDGDTVDPSANQIIDRTVEFAPGRDSAMELVDSVVDNSFDMIAIRIYGRSDVNNPTRLHANLVSNQEIQFGASEREARFHTATEMVTDMPAHANGIRQNNESSHVIPGSRR